MSTSAAPDRAEVVAGREVLAERVLEVVGEPAHRTTTRTTTRAGRAGSSSVRKSRTAPAVPQNGHWAGSAGARGRRASRARRTRGRPSSRWPARCCCARAGAPRCRRWCRWARGRCDGGTPSIQCRPGPPVQARACGWTAVQSFCGTPECADHAGHMSDSASVIRLSLSAADEQALDTRIAVLSAALPGRDPRHGDPRDRLQPPRHAAEPGRAAVRDPPPAQTG